MNRYARSWVGLMEQCNEGEWVKYEDVVQLEENHASDIESYFEEYRTNYSKIKDLEYRLEDAMQDKANYRLVSKLAFFVLILDVFASIAMRLPW